LTKNAAVVEPGGDSELIQLLPAKAAPRNVVRSLTAIALQAQRIDQR